MFRKYYKIFLVAFVIIYGIYFGVKGPLFNALNVKPSGSAEYIGIPLQQIGRMAYKNVKFTKEEKESINKLIPINIMKTAYDPNVSDGIKFNGAYNSEAFDKNKKEYTLLWAKLVVKHPGIATEAYFTSTLGYWYPGLLYCSVANDISANNLNIYTDSKIPALQNVFGKIEARNMPIVNITWSIGLCFWIISIFAYITKQRLGKKYLYCFVPLMGVWFTMMVASPVLGEFRYVYGAFACLPFFVSMPFIKTSKKDN